MDCPSCDAKRIENSELKEEVRRIDALLERAGDIAFNLTTVINERRKTPLIIDEVRTKQKSEIQSFIDMLANQPKDVRVRETKKRVQVETSYWDYLPIALTVSAIAFMWVSA